MVYFWIIFGCLMTVLLVLAIHNNRKGTQPDSEEEKRRYQEAYSHLWPEMRRALEKNNDK